MLETTTKYKDTPIGKIPVDWEVKKFEKIFDFYPTASYSRADLSVKDETLYLHYGDIHTKYHHHIDIDNSSLPTISDEKLRNYELVQNGDLVISDASEDYLGVGKCVEIINLDQRKMIAGLHTFLARDKGDNFAPYFKGYVTLNSNVVKQFRRLATGTKVYSISKGSLASVQVPLPPLHEQQKIAEILSTWDKAIQETDSIIKSLEKRNKVLAYSLLTGRKRVQACESEGWKVFNLGFYIEEYRKKPNDNSDLPVFTSSKNGLMMQSDYYSGSRMLSREDVDYNILPNGFITYRSRSDDGLFTFNRNDKGLDGLISGYYPVFGITNGNADFFLYFLNYFKRKLTKYSSGTSQLVLSIKSLKTAKFNFPTHQEQSKIAEILNAANKELQQYQQKLNNLKTQKKGLMQQLLTGKVRTV